jgi:Flp pilus assembly pilin Flp
MSKLLQPLFQRSNAGAGSAGDDGIPEASAEKNLRPLSPASHDKLEKFRRPCRKDRRGAALVEFALIAPLLFLFVFGIIEFGRAVMVQQIITNASREGARLGVLDGSTKSDVISETVDYLKSASLGAATDDWINVPLAPEASGFGDSITVEVEVTFDQVSWLPSPMFLGGKTFKATTVMRREASN